GLDPRESQRFASLIPGFGVISRLSPVRSSDTMKLRHVPSAFLTGDHMAKEEIFQTQGKVVQALANTQFRVKLDTAHEIVAPIADEAHCTVRPSFSFTRGNLDVVLRVADRQPTTALRFSLASKTLGGGADVDVSVALSPDGPGTKVDWVAELVKLSGLLKMVP